MANCLTAGCNNGNPLQGLDERVAIEAKKIYDGCLSRYQNEVFSIAISNITPEGATAPFTFVSASSCGEAISDYSITPLECNNNRIAGNLTVTIKVNFTDSKGNAFVGTGTIEIPRDLVLKIPCKAITPYTIETMVNLACNVGKFTSNTTVEITTCYIILTKVCTVVDILIPAYCYCVYPVCEEIPADVCDDWLDLPLFPTK